MLTYYPVHPLNTDTMLEDSAPIIDGGVEWSGVERSGEERRNGCSRDQLKEASSKQKNQLETTVFTPHAIKFNYYY